MKKTEKQKKIQELLRRLDRLEKPPVSSKQPQVVRQILPVVVKKESYGFTKEMLGIVRSLRRQLRGADKLTVAEVNKLATRVAEVEKKEVPETAPVDLAPIREEIQTLSAKVEAVAIEPIKQVEELRRDVFRHRGGGNMNRQILVDGNQSTLGQFTDINFIPGSNLGIAVSVDQTNQRTNFTLSASDLDRSAAWGSITGTLSNQTDLQNALNAKYDASNPSSYVSGVSWGSITGTLSNQTDLQTALDTKISSVLTDGTLIQTSGPHLSRASIVGDISIPQGSNLATLPTVNANAGTFGDSVTVSRVTVNAKGLVTAASNVGIAFPAVPAGVTSVVAGTGITVDNTSPNAPVVNLGTASVTAGTYGSATQVGRFTVDAQGRLSAASVVGITFPAVPAGVTSVVAGGGITVGNGNPATPIVERSSIAGDVTIPQGSVIATLAAVASNVGTFGSSTTVPQVQIDNKGRVVLASTVGIAFPAATTPAGQNTQVQFNDGGAFGASSTFAWNKNTSVLTLGNNVSTSVLSVDGPSSVMAFFGRMGVGTNNPVAGLHVAASAVGAGQLTATWVTDPGVNMGTFNSEATAAFSSVGSARTLNGFSGTVSVTSDDSAVWAGASGVFGGNMSAFYNGTGSIRDHMGLRTFTIRGGAGGVTNAYGISVTRSNSTGSGTVSSSVGIQINRPINTAGATYTDTIGVRIENQTTAAGTHTNTPYGIYQAGTGDRNFFAGTVGIGTATPNANASLDVVSTTKPFMPPRMTTTQRDNVASPTAGMVIFNASTSVLNFYNGTAWAAV